MVIFGKYLTQVVVRGEYLIQKVCNGAIILETNPLKINTAGWHAILNIFLKLIVNPVKVNETGKQITFTIL